MPIIQDYVVPILVGIIIFGGISWLFFLLHKFLAYIGLYQFFVYRRLKRRFKEYEFNDKIISFCEKAIIRGWEYKHLKLFAKGRKNEKEILYTYFVIDKLIMKGGYDEKRIREIKSKVAKEERNFYEEV